MATLVCAMNVSLDGYVDHDAFAPGPGLFRHWIAVVQGLAGSLYGRRVYELMRYWEGARPEWSPDEHAFAAAWRRQPKWVVSRSLTSVGPNATLVAGDVGATVRGLKVRLDGEIAVAGPTLAASLGALGLMDEYRLYLHPVVLGRGTLFFAGSRQGLRLVGCEGVGEDVVRLAYAPATTGEDRPGEGGTVDPADGFPPAAPGRSEGRLAESSITTVRPRN